MRRQTRHCNAQLMEVMDFLEDEIDEHTYDDLIPLQIRMALEDQVFGWDHFLSNILGHVVYTVGSYLLTFWLITFVVLHEVPWGRHVEDDPSRGGPNSPWGMPPGLFSFVRTALPPRREAGVAPPVVRLARSPSFSLRSLSRGRVGPRLRQFFCLFHLRDFLRGQ